ncbi:hypothetical protein BDY21DRAFT_264856, partial [Lineolata rhizophorae]
GHQDLSTVLATLASIAAQEQDRANSATPQHGVDQSRDPRRQTSPPTLPHASGKQEKPKIDPTTITDWSQGLRYVNKLTAANQHLSHVLPKMIAEQHRNEREWWEGREALIQKQRARQEGSKKIDDVLYSPEANGKELATYDKKVINASQDMVRALSSELKRQGVPFFGTKPHLIAP